MSSKVSTSSSKKSTDPGLAKRQPRNMNRDNDKIIERFKKKVPNQTMLETRQALPAWNEQENMLKALENHQVLVVSGMTGCGKSTQVPQYILDASLNKGKDYSIWSFILGYYWMPFFNTYVSINSSLLNSCLLVFVY